MEAMAVVQVMAVPVAGMAWVAMEGSRRLLSVEVMGVGRLLLRWLDMGMLLLRLPRARGVEPQRALAVQGCIL
jgi:hypothetical protein